MRKTLTMLVKNAPSILKFCFGFFFVAVHLLLLIVDKHEFYYASENEVLLPNTVLSLIVLPLALVCVHFARRTAKRSFLDPVRGRQALRFYLFAGAFFTVLYALQLFIAKNIYFYGGWNFGMLISNARNVAFYAADGVDRWYFGMYPNNLTAVYLLVWLFRLGTVLTPLEPYITVLAATSLFVNLSVFMASLCVFRITHNRFAAVVTMLLGAFLIALSPWIVVPYTDALAMVFPAAAVFFSCYLKRRPLKSFLITLFLFFGSFLKPTVLIVFVAFALAALVRVLQNKPIAKHVAANVLTAGLAVLFAFSLRYAFKFENKTELAAELRMPFTHFLMMGLNHERNGVYSDADVAFSSSFPDVKSRQAGNIAVIKTRLSERGLLTLFMKKMLCNFNDGTFAWGLEGNFYMDVPKPKTAAALNLRKFFYNYTHEHAVLATTQQAAWLFLLFCMLGCTQKSTKPRLTTCVAMLALLGVGLFLLLFECRARYLYVFSPILLLLMGCGLAGRRICRT